MLVELGVAGRHAGERRRRRRSSASSWSSVSCERVVDADHRVGDAPLGDLEHERLGAVERLGDVVGLVVAHLGDVAGDAR